MINYKRMLTMYGSVVEMSREIKEIVAINNNINNNSNKNHNNIYEKQVDNEPKDEKQMASFVGACQICGNG